MQRTFLEKFQSFWTKSIEFPFRKRLFAALGVVSWNRCHSRLFPCSLQSLSLLIRSPLPSVALFRAHVLWDHLIRSIILVGIRRIGRFPSPVFVFAFDVGSGKHMLRLFHHWTRPRWPKWFPWSKRERRTETHIFAMNTYILRLNDGQKWRQIHDSQWRWNGKRIKNEIRIDCARCECGHATEDTFNRINGRYIHICGIFSILCPSLLAETLIFIVVHLQWAFLLHSQNIFPLRCIRSQHKNAISHDLSLGAREEEASESALSLMHSHVADVDRWQAIGWSECLSPFACLRRNQCTDLNCEKKGKNWINFYLQLM